MKSGLGIVWINSRGHWVKMPDFADLAGHVPTPLPTPKLLIVIHLPTLPTFNAPARIRVNT